MPIRRTFAQTVARSKWVWFASIPLALGLIFLSAAAYLQWSTLNFRNHAGAIEGRVVRTWRSTSYSTSFRNGNPTWYMAAYEFELDPGGTFRGTDDIGYWGWQRLKPGDRLTVYYLPTAPRRNGLSRPWFSAIALAFGALASMLLFVGGLGVYCVVGDLRKAYIARRPAARHSSSTARTDKTKKPLLQNNPGTGILYLQCFAPTPVRLDSDFGTLAKVGRSGVGIGISAVLANQPTRKSGFFIWKGYFDDHLNAAPRLQSGNRACLRADSRIWL